jgi:hypothetical protein
MESFEISTASSRNKTRISKHFKGVDSPRKKEFMGDIAGFLTAILSLWMGGGRALGRLRHVAERQGRIEWARLKVALVPTLAGIARRTLIIAIAIICLTTAVAIGASEEPRAFIAMHTRFIIVVIFCIGALAALYVHQGDASDVYLTNNRMNPNYRYPAGDPLEGLRQIDPQRYNENAFRPTATVLLSTVTLILTGGGIMVIGYENKNLALFVIGCIPVILALIFISGVGYWTIKFSKTGGDIGAWVARLGLSQALIPLLNVTSDNVGQYTDPIRIPDDEYDRKYLVICEDGMNAFVIYAAVIGSFFNDYVTLIFTPVFILVVWAVIRNNRVNPNLGNERRKWLAKRELVILATISLLGSLVRYTEIMAAPQLYWGFLLGRYCLPVSDGGWLHLLFSLAVIVGILYALGKWAQWKDWSTRWKIVTGVIIGSIFVLFPLRYAFAIGARIDDEAEVCMPGSDLTPMKGEIAASSSDTQTKWWPAPVAETPRALAPAPWHYVPQRSARPFSDLEGLTPGLRADIEAAKRNGEL